MSVLTEEYLRKMMSEGVIHEKGIMNISKDTIITPSAKTFLIEKNITTTNEPIVQVEKLEEKKEMEEKKQDGIYETLFGVKLNEKPEHMTHLRGNLLVFKNHPRIRLRGAIDQLESNIILFQIKCKQEIKENKHGKEQITISDVSGKEIKVMSDNYQLLIDDLEEIIAFIRRLLRCELTQEEVGNFLLQGLNEDAIHEQSYHPSKYFGIRHFLPGYQYGEVVANLNYLRTRTREVELLAFTAFQDENGQIRRVDIIRAFNRLSSLFWIMMFKWLSGKYH